MAKHVVTIILKKDPNPEIGEMTSGQRIVTPRLERFLLERFATTLEDLRTGRKIAGRATETPS